MIDDWPSFLRTVARAIAVYGSGTYAVIALLHFDPWPGLVYAIGAVACGIFMGCLQWFAEQANAELQKK